MLGAVAVGQRDLKQLLAASTSAQLGYVVLAAGSSVAAGTAQLVAHAATKALLFLVAGVWLAALGSQQLGALTGTVRRYRVVGATFVVGALALAGVPPLSLWASKDAVLSAARSQSTALYVVGLAGAVLSAAYAGKALGVLARPARLGGADVPWLAQAPLVVLAAAAAGLSVLELPPVADALRRAVGEPAGHPTATWELALGAVLALVITGAAARFATVLPAPRWARSWLGLEAAANALVVRPVLGLARTMARADDGVLDRAVHGLVVATRRAALLAARLDDIRVDGVVRGVADGARRLGEWARRPQTGQVHQYYAQAVVGLAIAVAILVVIR